MAHRNHPIRKSYFLDKNSILKKYLDGNNQMFHQYIVPAAMVHAIMQLHMTTQATMDSEEHTMQ